ncbi:TPA_asm: hypothetical protein [Coelastrella green algae MELD virus]|nr:TPA_asm: hypothetical protein [Coelastrella green algae MELD virus]
MKINQLFRSRIPLELVELVAKAFGLKGIRDSNFIGKLSMYQCGTVQQVECLVADLRSYYLPCKARMYLALPLTPARCLTILNQLLRLHDYRLYKTERAFCNCKHKLYYIAAAKGSLLHIKRCPIELTFC